MVKEYGYEYDAKLNKKVWESTRELVTYDKFMGAMCLRSGRDALKTIAREYNPTIVLLPALSCDSMVMPFIMYGHQIKYYKINNDYSVDTDYLRTLITDVNAEVLFLYMDYFGNKSIIDSELEKLKKDFPKMVFIEDRTHNLLNERNSEFEPQYIMASLRKWIGIPDGGVLWSSVVLKNNFFSEELEFSKQRLKAQCMRNEFLLSANYDLKTTYRKLFSTVSDIIDKDINPCRMSAYSYEILKQIDFNMVKEKRKINAEILIDELRKQGFHFIQDIVGESDLYVAILVKNRNVLQQKLAQDGVFCTIIWPLSVEQKRISEVAKYTEEHMLAIYCDQRYTLDDMKHVASRIVEFSNE